MVYNQDPNWREAARVIGSLVIYLLKRATYIEYSLEEKVENDNSTGFIHFK